MAAASIVIDLIARTGSFQTDTARAERALKSLQKQIGDTKRVSEGFGYSFGQIGNQLKLLGTLTAGSFGVASIAKAADSYTKFTSQLRLATNDAQAFQSAYNEVIRIASQSQSDIEAVGTLYARLSINLKDVGITSAQLSDTTETVALALRVSGATAKETASVLLQLSQAFGAGRLNGQEFAAVAEAAPILLQQLAKSMGVPIGALKDLAAEGKLTRKELLKALTDQEFTTSLRGQVKEVQTISSSVTELGNRFKIFVGEQDKATGASKALANTILFLAENINALATGALVLITAQTGRYIGSKFALIAAISQTVAIEQAEAASKQRLLALEVTAAKARLSTVSGIEVQNLALANNAQLTTLAATRKVGLIQAETALAAATKASTASVTLFNRAIGLLGGPIGTLVTTLGLGILAFNSFGLGAETAAEKLKRLREEAKYSSNENAFAKDLDIATKSYNDALSKLEKIKQTSNLGLGAGVGIAQAQAELDAAKKILDDTRKAYDDYAKDIEKRNKNLNKGAGQFAVDTSGFEELESKLKTLTALTREYEKAKEDAKKQAKEQGISEDRLNEVLSRLKTQYDRDVESLNKVKKAKKETKDETVKFIESLEKQFQTFGLSSEATLRYEASLLKVTPKQKALIDTLIDGLEVKAKNKEADDEAKKLNEEALTPLEKLTAQYEKLIKLQQNGLTDQGFNQGLKDAVADFENAESGALKYGDVLDELNRLYEESTKYGLDVKNISLQLTISYNDLFQQLKDGTITLDEFNRKSQDLLKTFSAQAKEIDRLNSILGQTESAKLQEQIDDVNLLWKAYTEGINGVKISLEQFEQGIKVLAEKNNKHVKDSADFLEEAFKRAAQNAQDAFADFLFDPFKDGLDGMLLNFVNVLRRMAAEALAAEIFKKIFQATGTKDGGDLLGKIFSGIAGIFGGGKASGGDVLAGRTYLVGERGPEMFTPRSNGTITPNAQTMTTTANVAVKNINVLDPTLVGQYLNTDAGEKVVMNVIQRNRSALGF